MQLSSTDNENKYHPIQWKRNSSYSISSWNPPKGLGGRVTQIFWAHAQEKSPIKRFPQMLEWRNVDNIEDTSMNKLYQQPIKGIKSNRKTHLKGKPKRHNCEHLKIPMQWHHRENCSISRNPNSKKKTVKTVTRKFLRKRRDPPNENIEDPTHPPHTPQTA